jgi:hypothetical protein
MLETLLQMLYLHLLQSNLQEKPLRTGKVLQAIFVTAVNLLLIFIDISAEAAVVRVFDSPWATLKTDNDKTACIKPDYTIHGSCNLPKGYELAYVSADLGFEDDPSPKIPTRISCSYNLVGGLISLAQAFYASITLYQAKGDQITRYGYAAFGLTVAPFVVMSIINLIGNLLTPQYPALYLVDSTIMAEARKRDGFHIEGVVGKLKEASESDLTSLDDNKVWIQSLSFDQGGSGDPLSVHFQSRLSSASSGSPTQETSFLVIEDEDAIELSNRAKELVQVEEQERTHLVLQEATESLASELDGTRCVLYIPSCPQFRRSSAPKEPKQQYTINKTPSSQSEVRITSNYPRPGGRTIIFSLFLCFLPIVIVGALSHFQSGSSTTAERAWTMAWLSSSIVGGFLVAWTHKPADRKSIEGDVQGYALLGYIVIFGAPAIGGLVVVGEMIREYGTCIQLP